MRKYYFNGAFLRDEGRWWMKNGRGGYEPVMQLILGSPAFLLLAFIVAVIFFAWASL